jgi:hypothetical protein
MKKKQFKNRKAEEAKLSKVAASENSDNNGTTSDMAFKNIRQRLSEIQARLDQLKVKNQKAIVPPQQQKERGVVRPAEVQKQQGVNFRPQPLQLSKVIGGGSPSAEKAEEQKDDAGVAGRNNTAVNKVEERVTTEERIINVFKNSTEEQFHSAGFIRRLKPGERIKILSTNESKRNDGTELIQLVNTLFLDHKNMIEIKKCSG